ncbi:glycoprotein-N-acetylgalactosamine 3-beta-galactosyltransferase 1-like [Patiria miniata]|uniref:Glycoprotein-N-acetylgalactosamine 3-beta-galactosyltransferase 1 n=1 Tax=Patiria miniata TaxID=46514 RepID=A0A913Z311_PATMI|nr:glycoprotein-N-acetylgalactosamine 3-beta-galactosyltransferase 1-like [Patiria miniata]
MARNIRGVFITLLAFASGSFFTWTLTLYSIPESRSQKLAKIFDMEHQALISSDASQKIQTTTQHGPSSRREHEATKHSTNASIRNLAYLVKASNPVRILCWVMTSPKTLHTRASSVRDTWGPRCDVTLYMSSQSDPDFPAVGLDVAEGRDALWSKTKASFLYIYQHHFNDADWFMKADDDTYVIVDNLRHFLRDKDSCAPVYYGHHFQWYIEQGYMSGGAGYLMSKEALVRLVGQLRMEDNCGAPKPMTLAEDLTVGQCMMKAGVLAGDSRDELNRSRFLPFDLETFFKNNLPDWYFKFAKYRVAKGLGCCSDSLITIHYVKDRMSMMLLDFYIHGIQVKTSG